MRMTDTKGASLRWIESFDYSTMEDITTLASWLEAHAPGSEAALRTRRVVALIQEARRVCTDDNLNGLWADIAYSIDNGYNAQSAVTRHVEQHPLARLGEPNHVEVTTLVEEARGTLRSLEEARDRILVRGNT